MPTKASSIGQLGDIPVVGHAVFPRTLPDLVFLSSRMRALSRHRSFSLCRRPAGAGDARSHLVRSAQLASTQWPRSDRKGRLLVLLCCAGVGDYIRECPNSRRVAVDCSAPDVRFRR